MKILKTLLALILICQTAFIAYQVYNFNTPIEIDAIVYPDIAIDLTIPKHKQSRKYMTCKHCENKGE